MSESAIAPRPAMPPFDGRPQQGDRPFALFLMPSMSFVALTRRSLGPPLSILTLAGLARREGWDSAAVDLLHDPLPSRRPDLVGINCNTATAPMAYLLARAYREQGVPVIVGGSHASVLPQEALVNADAVFVGEAEGALRRVLSEALSGEMNGIYEGSWDSMEHAPRPSEYQDLVGPSRARYVTPYSYQTTRGCRFNCSYCSVIRINGRGQRRRPAEQIVDDFRYFCSLGGESAVVNVVDDDLAADREGSLAMCEALAAAGSTVRWGSQASIGIAADAELLNAAARAGVRHLSFGLESLERQNLLDVNKKNRPSMFRELIAKVRRAGIEPHATFMIGLDHDTPESLGRMITEVGQLDLSSVSFSIATPNPGTNLFAQMSEEGRIVSYDWALYDGWHSVLAHPYLSGAELQSARARMQAANRQPRDARDAGRLAELIAATGLTTTPTWVSYECDPNHLADLTTVSRSDTNDALANAVRLARRPIKARGAVTPQGRG